ncbi:MAG: hypothetical protein WC454_09690 [Phycisphaerae bacterium]
MKIIKNYPGSGKLIKSLKGLSYQQGCECDLPDAIAKVLLKNSFAQRTVAPWTKKLNPLMPKIQAYKTDFAEIEEALIKKENALKHAKDIAATIPACETDIKKLTEQRMNLQIEIITFANKNEIPVKDIVDGIQIEAAHTVHTAGSAAADSKSEDDDNAAGQAAPTGQTQE